jgi:NAD(P)-dependent dehydrogenase (short-subunit alcohol dehydrogenase family)
MSSLQYKKVLVLGATSGIGWALAAKVCVYVASQSNIKIGTARPTTERPVRTLRLNCEVA